MDVGGKLGETAPRPRAAKPQGRRELEQHDARGTARAPHDVNAQPRPWREHQNMVKTRSCPEISRLQVEAASRLSITADDANEQVLSNALLTPGFQREAKTVIMIGECGEGKSFIVERITGESGLSSSSQESFTDVAQPFVTEDGTLRLVDTPGINPLEDQLAHNLQVAHAFSYGPVSLLCVVIKAQPRLDTTFHRVKSMAVDWDFPEILTIWITHMDQVEWGQEECFRILRSRFGLDRVMFSSNSSSGMDLRQQLLRLADQAEPIEIDIELDPDSQSFWNHFKLPDDHVEVLRSVRQEVAKYQQHVVDFRKFFEEKTGSEHRDAIRDLVFEFHAFMQAEIDRAQQRLRHKHCFSTSLLTVLENGHLANLANQLRLSLFEIRVMMTPFQEDSAKLQLRRCPHCNLLCAKPKRHDGQVICGHARALGAFDVGAGSTRWSFMVTEVGRLELGLAQHMKSGFDDGGVTQGCGRSMIWAEMKPVNLEEVYFEEVNGDGTMTVDDVLQGELKQSAPTNDFGTVQSKRWQSMVIWPRNFTMKIQHSWANTGLAVREDGDLSLNKADGPAQFDGNWRFRSVQGGS